MPSRHCVAINSNGGLCQKERKPSTGYMSLSIILLMPFIIFRVAITDCNKIKNIILQYILYRKYN